jgi:hypothetical protein
LPFTLGHSYLLDAGENSFAIDSAKPLQLEDLFPAVHLCTLGFRDGIRFLSGTVDATEWAEACKGLDMAQEAATFRAYVDSSLTIPKRKTSGKPSKCRAPWQLQLAAGLCDGGPLTRDAWTSAMDTPLSEAFVMLAARQAFQGDESLVGEEEAERIAAMRADPNFEPARIQ